MNEQQLFHYNLALKKSEKAESEVAELKNQLALLRTENAKAFEVEKVKREMAESNYETEKVKRELAERNCEVEKVKREMAESNYETEKVKRELAERNCEAEKVKREMAERNYEREVEKIKFAECALEKENAKQKKNINKIGELRNAETMLRQAKQFEEKKKALKNPSESVLSKLRYECECITKRPLLTMSHTQWIYGILHAAMGPVIKVLGTIEDDALKQDLKDLEINIQSSAEIRKSNKNLKTEVEYVKSHIEELKNAIKTSKIILPKWKKIRRTPMKDQPICESPYCVQNLFGTDPSPLFLTFLKCKCGSFIHASCDLLFVNYEIQYAQDTEYLCPSCDPISTEGALKDLEARQADWEKDLTELKEILKKKEQELKDTKVEIPYERCVTYQKIQSRLKELKVRKNLYFQKLNGVDVRKLITHRETFISVIKEDFQEDVRSLFACLNTFQELAEKQFLTDADIDTIDSAELKRAYKVIE
uniref:RING-type domain-containing protein n=1 Tax=Panagrolaimus davidi TaxID=227884 RepID=A0A914PLT2_9BILA